MITIKQLAGELKLSTATVSMALRHSPLISEPTRLRVLELARRRNYVPNNFGRGLQSRRSRLIGYVLGGVTQSFSNELFERAGYTAAENGYGILTGWVHADDAEGEFARQLQLLLEKNVDGLLFTVHPRLVAPHVRRLAEMGKPFVFCSEHAPAEYNYVVDDDRLGGRLAVACLARYGHREIMVCDWMRPRFEGYCEEAEAAGMVYHVFSDAADAMALLDGHPGVTAAACYSDHQGIDLKRRLIASGRRVPEDFSVIGFDGMWFTGLPEFDLTTIAQQRSEIGERSVLRLLELIEGERDVRRIFLEPFLVERGSVSAPPSPKKIKK